MGHKPRPGRVQSADEYFARVPPWQQELAAALRDLVLATVPGAQLAMKWGAPVFSLRDPFAYLGCFSQTVNLGFLHGAQLHDPGGLLRGAGREGRHMRFRCIENIDAASVRPLLQQAAARARGASSNET